MLLLFNNSFPYSEEFRKYPSLFEIHKLFEKCWQNADEETENLAFCSILIQYDDNAMYNLYILLEVNDWRVFTNYFVTIISHFKMQM